MNIALWIVQALMGLLFLFAGSMKLLHTAEVVTRSGLPAGFVIFLGLAEVAGGLGLILPSALRVKPVLTPVAAICLIPIMLGAIYFDLKNGTPPMTILFAALLAFIAWGRLKKAPVSPRVSPATSRG